VIGKGNQERLVPLPEAFGAVFGFWLKDRVRGEFVFARATGQKPVSAQAARAYLRGMLQKAGIDKKISPHKLDTVGQEGAEIRVGFQGVASSAASIRLPRPPEQEHPDADDHRRQHPGEDVQFGVAGAAAGGVPPAGRPSLDGWGVSLRRSVPGVAGVLVFLALS
jgi:hypothetical protein